MCATCFGLYLGHPQAYQNKNLAIEVIIRIKGALCLHSLFFFKLTITLKHKIQKYNNNNNISILCYSTTYFTLITFIISLRIKVGL